jgi:hypothetical protein
LDRIKEAKMDTLEALKVSHEIVDDIIKEKELKEPVITGTMYSTVNLLILKLRKLGIDLVREGEK